MTGPVPPSGEAHEITAAGTAPSSPSAAPRAPTLSYDGHPLVVGYAVDEQCSWVVGSCCCPGPIGSATAATRSAARTFRPLLTEVARGHASHGLTRWESWSIRERTAASVALGYRLMSRSGYPWTLDLTATYTLSGDGLAVAVTAVNHGSSLAPHAAGAHPYLTAGSGDLDPWQLQLPARRRW